MKCVDNAGDNKIVNKMEVIFVEFSLFLGRILSFFCRIY